MLNTVLGVTWKELGNAGTKLMPPDPMEQKPRQNIYSGAKKAWLGKLGRCSVQIPCFF